MQIKTLYICDVCGTAYASEHAARTCEEFVLLPCPVKPGDKVKVYERYDPPADDEVVSVQVGQSFDISGILDGWLRVNDEAGFWKVMNLPWHEWFVTVKNNHRISKDPDGYADTVTLDRIMVDGAFLRGASAEGPTVPRDAAMGGKE